MVEQLDYNLLFRWFVGLGMDDAVWNHAVFSKNRDRLLSSAVAQQFFSEVNRQAKTFMSDEHFTVDGTLIQAWRFWHSDLAHSGGLSWPTPWAERTLPCFSAELRNGGRVGLES